MVAKTLPSGDQEGHLPMHSNMGVAPCCPLRWARTMVEGSREPCLQAQPACQELLGLRGQKWGHGHVKPIGKLVGGWHWPRR